jgi:hypothetical protein
VTLNELRNIAIVLDRPRREAGIDATIGCSDSNDQLSQTEAFLDIGGHLRQTTCYVFGLCGWSGKLTF